MELSRSLGAGKHWDEAVRILEAEQKKSPDPGVQKGLAIAVFEAGDLVRGKELLKEVNARYPGDLDIMRAIDRLERVVDPALPSRPFRRQ